MSEYLAQHGRRAVYLRLEPEQLFLHQVQLSEPVLGALVQQSHQDVAHVVGEDVVLEEVGDFVHVGVGTALVQPFFGDEFCDGWRWWGAKQEAVEDSTYCVDVTLPVDLVPICHEVFNDFGVSFIQFAIVCAQYPLQFLS